MINVHLYVTIKHKLIQDAMSRTESDNNLEEDTTDEVTYYDKEYELFDVI